MNERWIGGAFVVSMLASAGLVLMYVFGGDAQIEGVLLGLALGGLGAGIAAWGAVLLRADDETEEREPLASGEAEVASAESALKDEPVTRRSALVRLLVAAGGVLGGALSIPALSLGPRPGQSLFRTGWTAGLRLVDVDENPVRPADLILDSVTTVFPEGAAGSADAQTLLIKIEPELLPTTGERAEARPGASGIRRSAPRDARSVSTGLSRTSSYALVINRRSTC